LAAIAATVDDEEFTNASIAGRVTIASLSDGCVDPQRTPKDPTQAREPSRGHSTVAAIRLSRFRAFDVLDAVAIHALDVARVEVVQLIEDCASGRVRVGVIRDPHLEQDVDHLAHDAVTGTSVRKGTPGFGWRRLMAAALVGTGFVVDVMMKD
jgi:hypothetical protein